MEFEKPTLHNKNLIKTLKDCMAEWNMSALALAEDIGVPEIYRWLNGIWPNSQSCELLLDYFGIDFTQMFAYYTPDGKLMFEGSHELFLTYLDISYHHFYVLARKGKLIRKSLPIKDGECEPYKIYDVSPDSFKANYSRVFAAYSNGEMIVKGNAEEVTEPFELNPIYINKYIKRTEDGTGIAGIEFYHVGYDFKKNLEERA